MMGRIWIKNEGLRLFRARRKNSRKWLEGYSERRGMAAPPAPPKDAETLDADRATA